MIEIPLAILIALNTAPAAAGQGAGDGPSPASLAGAIEARKARASLLTSIACIYTRSETPSDHFVREMARDANVSEQQIREEQQSTFDCRYDELATGAYRYEHSQFGTDGRKSGGFVLSHDGKETWRESSSPVGDGEFLSQYTVGADILPEFERRAFARGFLGDSVIPGTKPPAVKFLEGDGVEAAGEEVIDGRRCLVVTREELVNGAEVRTTWWLDAERQYIVLRSRVEQRRPSTTPWLRFKEVKVEGVGSVRAVKPSGGSFEYWYPKEVVSELFGHTGETSFVDRVSIKQFTLNAGAPPVPFTPRIEDGSNVHDVRTGSVSVHGNGPSPRLRALVEGRVRQSKESLRDVPETSAGVQGAPAGWWGYGSWAALAVGVIGLATAFWLRRRA